MGGVGRHAQANQVHGTAQGRWENTEFKKGWTIRETLFFKTVLVFELLYYAEYHHFSTDIHAFFQLLVKSIVFIFINPPDSRWPVKSAEFLLHMLKVILSHA